jgi:N-carbamoyl-L-amino-acid hydrolase
MRTLSDNGVVTDSPLELVDWTNEEGSRFAPTMIASGAFAGIYTTEYAHGLKDRQGNTFRGELERIGYLGDRPAGDRRPAAYFELHIEQGPILDQEHVAIGVVTGAQGQRWYDVAVTGRDSHAGSTPMPTRKDAMLACARVTDGVNRIALSHAPLGMSTVGLVEVRPNSRNVIPGHVFFTVDLRHPDGAVLTRMHEEYGELVGQVAAETRTDIASECVRDRPPTRFDERCVATVREVAERLGYSHRDIVSGPGHDAVNVARVLPVGMVFVPCIGGISHNEAEAARPDELAAGASVLLQSILEYDRKLSAVR